MNRVYRVVRNAATGLWVVASEFAKGQTKNRCRMCTTKSAVAATVFGLVPAFADAQTTTYTPGTANNEAQAINVNGGSASLDGSIAFSGSTALVVPSYRLTDAYNLGYITGATDPNGKIQLGLGTANAGVTVVDPITHGAIVVNTYSSNGFSETLAGGNNYYKIYRPTTPGQGQFVDATIANVSGGGTFDLNANGRIGDPTTKNTTFVRVTDGIANWNSSNTVSFTTVSSPSDADLTPYTTSPTFHAYNGTFTVTTTDGPQIRTVSNLAELKVYNDWLVSQLQAGKLGSGAAAQTTYNNALALAYTSTPVTYTVTPYSAPISADDPIRSPVGTMVGMLADGKNAVGHLGKTGVITSDWNGGSTGGLTFTLLKATNGGSIVNDGTVNSVRFSRGMVADAGGHLVNNGVRNVGDAGDGRVAEVNPDIVTGAGTTYENNGVVNQSTWNFSPIYGYAAQYGLLVQSGATATNNGAYNVGVNPAIGPGKPIGVQLGGGGTFVNGLNGVMYLGRAASSNTDLPSAQRGGADVVQANGATGIEAHSNDKVRNDGAIIIGDKVQNGQAINVAGTGVNVTNNGTIEVKGHYSASPLANVGIYSVATSGTVNNAGVITLEGVNTIGIQTKYTGKASSSGTINVAGGADPTTGLRNYGVCSEGTNSSVQLTGGAVNLAGDGAIGVHARDGGNIKVAGGTVNFVSGSNQIGVFAYGSGSSVDINSAPAAGLNVSTDGSTLFRIEDGAKVNNNAGAKLIASGKDSTALQVTGVGSTANLDGMDITVAGDGATALKVEGGATGQMSGAAKLTLKDGATAVVVDNTKYDLTGQAVGAAQSTFSNRAAVTVTNARDVTAFVVKNGATLTNAGDIHLAHGTAIEVIGPGSTVAADASGQRGSITVDDGVAGIHVYGGASLTTADTITVDNGASGVLVGADAGRVVIQQDARITGKGSSYGNLITNASAAGNVLVDGATLEMQGSGAALLSEHNLDAASHGQVIVSSQVGGKGIALSRADGGLSDDSLELGPNWQIAVTGNGAGVYANTTGDLTLAGTQISLSGPGVGVQAEAAGNVTLASGTRIGATQADAVLVAGNPTSLLNEGSLQAASADAAAVRLGAGNDAALLEDSVLDGALLGGAGDDQITVRGNNVSHGVLDGGLGGFDTLVFDGHDYTADAGNTDQLRNFEQFDLSNDSHFDLQRDLALGDDGNGQGSLSIDPTSRLAMTTGSFTLKGNLNNAGLVTLGNGQPGNVLTVDGNYTGNDGTLELDTELGDDNSPTDKLRVTGDTAGSSYVKVNATADTGAYTQRDGIQVVQVDGSSAGRFTLSNRVVAGAREYLLVQGGKSNPADGNWYLRSEAPVSPPDVKPEVDPDPKPKPDVDPDPKPKPEVDPDPKPKPDVDPDPKPKPEVDPDPKPKPDVDPDPRPKPEVDPDLKPKPDVDPDLKPEPDVVPDPKPDSDPTPVYRPEVGAYLGNQLAALGMFQHTLHDRLGEVDFTERQRSEGGGQGTPGRVDARGRPRLRQRDRRGPGALDHSHPPDAGRCGARPVDRQRQPHPLRRDGRCGPG